MKRLFTLMAVMTLSIAALMAQAPDLINYQAVARDGNGDIMANQSINVTFIIHSGSVGGPVEFEEDHTSVSTNDFGLFSLQIGSGSNVSGSIGGIDWGADSHWLEVEVNGASISTQQLISVPYALEAGGPWTRNGSDLMYSQGDVGIGAAPAFNLQVTSASDMAVSPTEVDGRNAHIHLRNTSLANGTMVGLGFGVSSISDLTGGAIVFERTGTDSQGKLHFATRDAVLSATPLPIRMTIGAEGNVGIGTTSPSFPLHLALDTFSINGLEIANLGSSNLGLDGDVVPYGGSVLAFDLGNNNTTQHWDDVVATDFVTFSDQHAKQNIEPLSYGLAEVLQLNTYTYQLRPDLDPAQDHRYGVMAQELQSILPSLVVTEDVDFNEETGRLDRKPVEILGVKYMEMIPVLIKAIQEQQTQMETMQAEIEALKQELEDLKK